MKEKDGITINKLKQLIAIAETQSFSAAADSLGLAQSSLTSSIKSLEKSLGFKVLNRGGKGVVVSPTEEGMQVIEVANCIMKKVNKIKNVGVKRVVLVTDVIRWEEGVSLKPYIDTLGYPSIGIGKRIGPKNSSLDNYQLEITEDIAEAWLIEEVNKVRMCEEEWAEELFCENPEAIVILISMEYQLGYNGLSKFKKMIQALKDRDYPEAKKQALDSLWAKQTPERAMRHARVLGGEPIETVYKDYI